MATDEIKHTDILLDDTYDVVIRGGDIVVDDSQEQEGQLILRYHPGTLRSDPLCGVGISDWVNADVTPAGINRLDAIIRQQFDRDDKVVDEIGMVMNDDGELLDVQIDFDQR